MNDCLQRNGVVFGMGVQQTAPHNYLNTSNPYGESFHNPFSDCRFPKVLVRVLYHQEPERIVPLGLSNKTKVQQSDENILYTGQSGLRIDRVWSMAVKAKSQSYSVNANYSPLDVTVKDAAGHGSSGMGRLTPQISSVVDNKFHQPEYISGQDHIEPFSKYEAPIAIITPQLNSEQLQQNTSANNKFDFNACVSVSGEFLTNSPDKLFQKAYLKPERRKAYRRAYGQSKKGIATRKAYKQSDKGMAVSKAYEQSDTRRASHKVYQQSDKGRASRNAYEQSEKGKAARKAYAKSDKRKAAHKAYRESEIGRAYQKAYHKALKNTGDKEQAKLAGKKATAAIRKRKLKKARKSELESISISPLTPPLGLTGKSKIEG